MSFDQNYSTVEVLNRNGAAEIFFTVDGEDPTVEGDNCEILPSVISALSVDSRLNSRTVVKLVSLGAPTFSVSVE